MNSSILILMEKNKETGYLEKELGSFSIESDLEFIDRIFVKEEDGIKLVHLYLTVPGEFNDSEYNDILDCYDIDLYSEKVFSVEEDEENYNPAWIIKFEYIENHSDMEEKLNSLLKIHTEEIKRVLEVIRNTTEG